MFFFEKKNQKTFSTDARSLTQAPESESGLQEQKFFGSFFQKRTSFRLPPSINPSAISIVEGIRAGLAAAVPMAASVWFHRPDLTLAALGALLTCIVDPAGPMRRRLHSL